MTTALQASRCGRVLIEYKMQDILEMLAGFKYIHSLLRYQLYYSADCPRPAM